MEASTGDIEGWLAFAASFVAPLLIGIAAYGGLLRRNPGPFWAAVGFGVVAILVALVLQLPLLFVIRDTSDFRDTLAVVIVITSLSEEIVKLAGGWIVLLIFRNRAAGKPVFAAGLFTVVGLGFGGVENMFYSFGAAFAMPGNVWEVVLARSLATVPMHVTTGLIMGYFMARRADAQTGRFGLLAAALTVPYVLHLAFNLLVVLSLPEDARMGELEAMVDPVSTGIGAAMVYAAAAMSVWALWRFRRARPA